MKTRKMTILSFSGFLILFVSSFVWFFYENARASSVHHAVSMAQTVLSASEAELARERALGMARSPDNGVEKVIPQNREESTLIREFSQASATTGAKVQSCTFTTEAASSENTPHTGNMASNVIRVQMTVSGTTEQVLDFVDTLQSNRRMSLVNSFDYQVTSAGTQITLNLGFPYNGQG